MTTTRILNKHLLSPDCPVAGHFQLPQVKPFKGELPDVFLPYNAAVGDAAHDKGVYCHLDDKHINPTWTHPERALSKVKRYRVAVAPDYTLWVDARVCENVEQLRRNRTITRYWQDNGVETIQAASWGDAFSLQYAFDGLAEDSWTAVGHQRIGNSSEQRLFKYAVEKLVAEKSPRGLVVFGAPLGFDLLVEVRRYPSFITKLRNLKSNK